MPGLSANFNCSRAYLVGIGQYRNLVNLATPESDVKAIGEALLLHAFTAENIHCERYSDNNNNNIYGWGVAQFMFTPKNIDVTDIQNNDRPYAGALYSIHSLQSIDNIKKIEVTSGIRLGVIGLLSFAKETQTWAHRVINYTKSLDWGKQH